MKIREATSNDCKSISELYWESDNFHNINQPNIYSATEKPFRSEEFIKEQIEDKNSMFYIIEVEGDVIGFIYGYVESKGSLPIHKQRNYFYIDNIVVNKKFQAKGYGRMLLDKVISECKEKKYSDIMLNVYSFNNNAISLYDNIGFKEVAKDMILQL
ncbi:GNAT family N-acetyltransferase [Thiospirochaeta perfilievii]|uniref:GNAT family N-acetyltransferase n=1 Tax=Thiospirochaeta perfilievii TaxID=252967 RepID=A0A5C1QEW1_9SPIO|nr:GNAT family N-acetyltransferase [Thiospirochaeta perfilievii]QEN04762.1 GNAT family N-acetyltransferase [Thiospirochaeta perfilievii]